MRLPTLAAIFLALAAMQPAGASILTFGITNPIYVGSESYPEGVAVNQNYGDRVTSTAGAADGDTFSYGIGPEGFTPNVTVDYGPFSIFTGGPSLWRYNYGDLDRVLYQGSAPAAIGFDYDYLLVTLTADPGYEVALYGFDVAGWFETDYQINGVAVYDNIFNGFFPAQNRVFYDQNATILGAGPTHSTYSFGTPVRGNVVTILIDANNLGQVSENIGIDNIRFGQELAPAAVPEPASLAIWGLGTIGCAVAGYRRRKLA